MWINRAITLKTLWLGLIIALILVSCGTPAPTLETQKSPIQVSPLVSPLSTPGAASGSSNVAFQIDRPVHAGTTEVKGTGPAGVPVWIADVTFMGEVLGQGTVGPDGKFAIQVKPVESSHRIGVALAELNGTKWKAEDFYHPEFYGPDAMQLPQVGFFFDTVMVSEQ